MSPFASPPAPRPARSFDPGGSPSTSPPGRTPTAGVAATTAPNDPAPVWPPLASSVEFGDGGRRPVRPGVDDRRAVPPDQRAPGGRRNRRSAQTPLSRLLRARRPPDGVRRVGQPRRARRLQRDADADPRRRTHRHGTTGA